MANIENQQQEQIYTEKSTLKNWFRSKLKPTQAQFWAWMDSYWHKGEKLPISTIDGLGEAVDGKAPIVHYHDQYATNDATSLSNENVEQWKKKLDVDNLQFDDQAISLTNEYVDFGLTNVSKQAQFNQAIYESNASKLKEPTNEGDSKEYPYLVGIDEEGYSAKISVNTIGKVKTVNNQEPNEEGNIDLDYIPLSGTVENKPLTGLIKATTNQSSIEPENKLVLAQRQDVINSDKSILTVINSLNNDLYYNQNINSKEILNKIKTVLHDPIATPMEYIDGTYVKKTINNYQVVYEPTSYTSALNTITYNSGSRILKCTLKDILYKVYKEDNPKDFIFIKSKNGEFNIELMIDGEIIIFEEVLTGVETKIVAGDLTPPNSPTDLIFIGKFLFLISQSNTSVKIRNKMGSSILQTELIKTTVKILDMNDKNLVVNSEYEISVSDMAGNDSAPSTVIYKG